MIWWANLEAAPRFELGIKVLQTSALATWLCRPKKRWSERRDSNPRQPPWQGGALPAELLSHLVSLNSFLASSARREFRDTYPACLD